MARLKIKDAPLLTNIIGTEKIPTGSRGDFAITPDMLTQYFINKIPFVTQSQLASVKAELEAKITTVETTLSQSISALDSRVSDVESSMLGFTQDLALHVADQNNPHKVTKQQIGLGSVDNTSDINKPLSTATKNYVDTQITLANKGYNLDFFTDGKSYPRHAEIMLDNGIVVKSLINNNTTNPNSDMSTWQLVNIDTNIYTSYNVTQDVINLDVINLYNYVVYAEKYGNTLNTAMKNINKTFAGKRVRIYVPSDFPITDTVDIEIDCDLDLSTLQVKNGVDVIFNPTINWNGSTTPCDVKVNNNSCRVGWNLKKPLGVVRLNKMRFFDVGDETTVTSGQRWVGFDISIVNIKKLDLYEPSTIGSYVVPNSVIGDASGTNRNIIIDGVMTSSDFASDINIYNHTAIDLKTEEDSDALVVSTGSTSLPNSTYNIDIYGGYARNVQKRQYKFMLPNNPTGIRLHGTSVAIAGGSVPYTALDLYGDGVLEADGSIIGKGWLIGINSTESVKLHGESFNASFDMDQTVILGNQVRALKQTGVGTSDIRLRSLTGFGGTELFLNTTTHKLRIENCKHTSWVRAFSATGDYVINNLDVTIADAPISVTRSSYLIACGGVSRGVIRNITIQSTSSTKQQYVVQSLATENLTIENSEVIGNILSGAFIRAVSAKMVKLRKVKAMSASHLIRLESNCDKILIDQCTKPTSNILYYAVSSNSTNINEINTLIF